MTGGQVRRVVGLPWLAGVLAIFVLVGGCASGDGDPLPEAGAGAAPSNQAGAATPTEDAKQDEVDSDERVMADYRKHWEDVIAAHTAGDPALKRLTEHAINPRLSSVVQQIDEDKKDGKLTKGEPELLTVEVESREDDRAEVVSCMASGTWRYHSARSGEPLEELSKKRYVVTASLYLRQETWKVSTMKIQEDSCDG
jgi:hypothetical protein